METPRSATTAGGTTELMGVGIDGLIVEPGDPSPRFTKQ